MFFPLVFDRVPHISNPIYARVNSERDEYYPESELHARLVVRVNPIIVYCHTGDIPAVNSMAGVDGKSHKTAEHLREVREKAPIITAGYEQAMRSLGRHLPILRYNRYEDDQEKFILDVLATLWNDGDS